MKAHLALHNVYGVDLNATAVELAEISLWLDTMVEGLHAPWFGLHLKRGNSLIGARRAGFTRADLQSKSWLSTVPMPVLDHSVVGEGAQQPARNRHLIHHFLVPAEGWGAAADVGKDVEELVPEAVANLKKWRRSTRSKPTKKEVDLLTDLSRRVERLWDIASRRLEIAEQQVRRDIDVWGQPMVEERATSVTEPQARRHVTREEIEKSLADADGAYQRLRRVMDAWCALWFWPLTEDDVAPPTLEQWYDALRMILGSPETMSKAYARKGDDTLDSTTTWDELGDVEHNDRVYAAAAQTTNVLEKHPWMSVCERVAKQQGFFHWDLDFASVFGAGGFDLQTGNPPWVRPTSDGDALLAEGDPWWAAAREQPRRRFQPGASRHSRSRG